MKIIKKTLNQIKDINEYLNKQYLMQNLIYESTVRAAITSLLLFIWN